MPEATQKIVFRLTLGDESGVAAARLRARQLATAQGFPTNAVEALATAVSEVARNAVVYAADAEILLGTVSDAGRLGVVAIVRDGGPGIDDIEAAMRDGHSTGTGLGLGLPSAQRLVDDFEMRSVAGQGTTVTLKKWQRTNR